jgi:hypothetical protein
MHELCKNLKFDGSDAKDIFDFVGGRIEEHASLEIIFYKKLPENWGEEFLGDFCESRVGKRIKDVLQILGPTIHSLKIVELKYVSIYATTEGAEITLRWPV